MALGLGLVVLIGEAVGRPRVEAAAFSRATADEVVGEFNGQMVNSFGRST